jgi:hypothetical protein
MSTEESEAVADEDGVLAKDDFEEEEAHGESRTKLARDDIKKMLERHGVDVAAIDDLEDDDASTDEGEAADDDDD